MVIVDVPGEVRMRPGAAFSQAASIWACIALLQLWREP
jgi:hypothetical protein